MDIDGRWRPPEEWPENTPPLPGWSLDDTGCWSPPDEPEADPAQADDDPEAPDPNPQRGWHRIAPPGSVTEDDDRPAFELGFAAPAAQVAIPDVETRRAIRTGKHATVAAVLAAVTATMIAAGLIFLLSLV